MADPTTPHLMRRRRFFLSLALFLLLQIAVAVVGTGLLGINDAERKTWTIAFEVGTDYAAEPDAILDAVAGRLAEDPTKVAIITGHTGQAGDPQANRALSLDRARRIAQDLVPRGIAEDRLIARGAGGKSPPSMRDDESDAAFSKRMRRGVIVLAERRLFQ